MLVMGRRIASLAGEEAGLVHPDLTIREQSSAARCGDDLVAVEAENSDIAYTTTRTTIDGGPQRFGGVLDHGNFELTRDRAHLVHLRGHAIEMDGNDGPGFLAPRNRVPDRGSQLCRIHVPRVAFRIDK